MRVIFKKFAATLIMIFTILSITTEPTLAMSKKEIQKEIKSYEKVADANYKEWQKEKKKYKKQTKGTYIILAGDIISINPMIVQDAISGEYFYIKSGTSHIAALGSRVYLSYIKRTKQHQYCGIYYCTVATGVKVDAAPDQAEKNYKEYQEILDRLYAAKNATIKIKAPKKLRVNNTEELDYTLSNRDYSYSEVKVVSHSKNIEVDVDYFVTVKALEEGDAYIKLKCDSSGKTKTLKFHVYPEYDEVVLQDIEIKKDIIDYEMADYDFYLEIADYTYQPEEELDYKLVFKKGDDPKHYKGDITVTSSNDSIIEVIDNNNIKIKNTGTATVTISSGGISKTITYNISRQSTQKLIEKAEKERQHEEQQRLWEAWENGELVDDWDDEGV